MYLSKDISFSKETRNKIESAVQDRSNMLYLSLNDKEKMDYQISLSNTFPITISGRIGQGEGIQERFYSEAMSYLEKLTDLTALLKLDMDRKNGTIGTYSIKK